MAQKFSKREIWLSRASKARIEDRGWKMAILDPLLSIFKPALCKVPHSLPRESR
jgi:hypothetical protein